MPKSDSAQTLLKRLKKLERAQARLGAITTRVLAQADSLAELLKVAHAFAGQGAPARTTSRASTSPGAKRTSPRKRGTGKVRSAPRDAAAKRTVRAAQPAPRAPAAKPAPRRASATGRASSAKGGRRPSTTSAG